MKKLNKKGFTLAELLIVIAIIAILIAIAIPAFGSALDNARLQTDHANMRSAYAIAQVANLQGYIECDGHIYKPGDSTYDLGATFEAYFGADGTVTTNDDKAYVTSVSVDSGEKDEKCKSSAFCQISGVTHEKDKKIKFTYGTNGIELGLA